MAIREWRWGSFLIVVVVTAVVARFSYERGPASEPCEAAPSAESPEFRPHVRALAEERTPRESRAPRADSVRSAIRVGMEQVREEERVAQAERGRRFCELAIDGFTVAFWLAVAFLGLVVLQWAGSRVTRS